MLSSVVVTANCIETFGHKAGKLVDSLRALQVLPLPSNVRRVPLDVEKRMQTSFGQLANRASCSHSQATYLTMLDEVGPNLLLLSTGC